MKDFLIGSAIGALLVASFLMGSLIWHIFIWGWFTPAIH